MKPIKPTKISGQKIFPFIAKNVFNTDPIEVIERDNLTDYFQHYKIHCYWQGFINPGLNNPAVQTFAQYKNYYDSIVGLRINFCQENNIRAIVGLDDSIRTQGSRDFTWNSPIAEDCYKYAAEQLSESGMVNGVEMVDEVRAWPDEYGDVETLVEWWREAGGPPIAWPNQFPINWEVPELSDYSSRFFTHWFPGLTLRDIANQLIRATERVRLTAPFLLTISALGKGGSWQFLNTDGVNGDEILAQAWIALALGASGVRIYAYNWKAWIDQWNDPTFTGVLQTGVDFWQPDRSRGFIGVFESFNSFEQRLLVEDIYAFTLNGPWLCGRRGNFWWAINISNLPKDAGRVGLQMTKEGMKMSRWAPPGGILFYNVS